MIELYTQNRKTIGKNKEQNDEPKICLQKEPKRTAKYEGNK